MDYKYTLTFGLGGLGLLKRLAAAAIILLVLRAMDKTNPEYPKALKWLFIGGIICLLLSVLLWGLFAGVMGAFFAWPFFW